MTAINIEPILTRALNGGTQSLYRFPNGFGASVIQGPYTYGGPAGLWEVGVVTFDSDGGWELTYDTAVTDDVVGHLDDDELADLLTRISNLDGDGREQS